MIASVIVIKDCFVGCFKFTTSPDFADIPPGTPKKHKIVISEKKHLGVLHDHIETTMAITG